jgi:Zn-dependent oligopeptidase
VFLERVSIKFYVKLGKIASGTYAMLSKAYGREAVKKSGVSEWHKWFKESLHVKVTHEDNAHYFL